MAKTASLVLENPQGLSEIYSPSSDKVIKELIKFPGVGPKVAACVALFSYGCYDVFPLDVWTTRVLQWAYFEEKTVSKKKLEEFIVSHFGEHAGYVQQLFFHAARVYGDELFE